MTGIHSYQMQQNEAVDKMGGVFDWSKQWGDVPSGGSVSNNIIFETDGTTTDDAGEVYYSIEGTSKTFSIKALVDNSQSPPYRMHVVFDGWSPTDLSNSQDYYLDFPPDSAYDGKQLQLALIGGESYGYQTNQNPPVAWMQSIRSVIGTRKLKYICMPGTHDSGMSQINGKTSGASHDNTQTQVLNIYNQALRGARWFDIRPCLGNGGQHYLCHYSDVLGKYQGANGQLVTEAVQNITK